MHFYERLENLFHSHPSSIPWNSFLNTQWKWNMLLVRGRGEAAPLCLLRLKLARAGEMRAESSCFPSSSTNLLTTLTTIQYRTFDDSAWNSWFSNQKRPVKQRLLRKKGKRWGENRTQEKMDTLNQFWILPSLMLCVHLQVPLLQSFCDETGMSKQGNAMKLQMRMLNRSKHRAFI